MRCDCWRNTVAAVRGQARARLRSMLSGAVATLVSLSAPASATAAGWEPLGPQGDTVFSLVRHPRSAQAMLAGTYFGGLYVSLDWGFRWGHLATPFASDAVVALAFAPGNTTVLYAGVFQSGLFKSEDGGVTWVPRNAGLLDLNITAVAVDPFDASVVLVAT